MNTTMKSEDAAVTAKPVVESFAPGTHEAVKRALAAALRLPDLPGMFDRSYQAFSVREQYMRLDVDVPLLVEAARVGKNARSHQAQIIALLGDATPGEVIEKLERRCATLDEELSGMVAWYARKNPGAEEQIRAALGVPAVGEMFPEGA